MSTFLAEILARTHPTSNRRQRTETAHPDTSKALSATHLLRSHPAASPVDAVGISRGSSEFGTRVPLSRWTIRLTHAAVGEPSQLQRHAGLAPTRTARALAERQRQLHIGLRREHRPQGMELEHESHMPGPPAPPRVTRSTRSSAALIEPSAGAASAQITLAAPRAGPRAHPREELTRRGRLTRTPKAGSAPERPPPRVGCPRSMHAKNPLGNREQVTSLAQPDSSAYAHRRLRWSRKFRFPGLKRETGEHPLGGCKSGAAHATVSEPETARNHCAHGTGRCGLEDFTSAREPGDRPETRTRRLALGDVRPVTISAYLRIAALCRLRTLSPSPPRRTWRVWELTDEILKSRCTSSSRNLDCRATGTRLQSPPDQR